MRPTACRHHIPVKIYRALDMLTVAAPMAGLGPEDITVEVTPDGHLLLDGRLRPEPKVNGVALGAGKEILLDEWTLFPYHREIVLGVAVDGPTATVTYGNGVVVVALPVAAGTRPVRLTLDPIGPTRGERAGDPQHPAHTRRA
jgi:HSP20 family molecular chaperone IbpA